MSHRHDAVSAVIWAMISTIINPFAGQKGVSKWPQIDWKQVWHFLALSLIYCCQKHVCAFTEIVRALAVLLSHLWRVINSISGHLLLLHHLQLTNASLTSTQPSAVTPFKDFFKRSQKLTLAGRRFDFLEKGVINIVLKWCRVRQHKVCDKHSTQQLIICQCTYRVSRIRGSPEIIREHSFFHS